MRFHATWGPIQLKKILLKILRRKRVLSSTVSAILIQLTKRGSGNLKGPFFLVPPPGFLAGFFFQFNWAPGCHPWEHTSQQQTHTIRRTEHENSNDMERKRSAVVEPIYASPKRWSLQRDAEVVCVLPLWETFVQARVVSPNNVYATAIDETDEEKKYTPFRMLLNPTLNSRRFILP